MILLLYCGNFLSRGVVLFKCTNSSESGMIQCKMVPEENENDEKRELVSYHINVMV